jgi:hypothetical protein
MAPQTRMFRDRVVSMEQTFEAGEKHLALLQALCREALPEFEPEGHSLDHERDLFVMELRAADGRRKRICWTRMMLFDADRIPGLSSDPLSVLHRRIVDYLRARAGRPEIVVTFRHLEEGWLDTPEPRREKRRRRRGGRGEAKGVAQEAGRAPARSERRGALPPARPARPPAPASPVRREGAPGAPAGAGAPGPGRRRRFRRRRRSRGPGAPPSPSGAPN